MGMSHDFEAAVEEGATLVRVGTAIFGERRRRPDGRPGGSVVPARGLVAGGGRDLAQAARAPAPPAIGELEAEPSSKACSSGLRRIAASARSCAAKCGT